MQEVVLQSISEAVPYDESLLERARTQWQFGDWKSLAGLIVESIQHHPQREKLAILAASGHFQLGDKNEAYRFVRYAQDWGCSRKLIAQVLVSGVHNALGCATAVIDEKSRSLEHFSHAVKLGGVPGDTSLLIEARAARQLSELSLIKK